MDVFFINIICYIIIQLIFVKGYKSNFPNLQEFLILMVCITSTFSIFYSIVYTPISPQLIINTIAGITCGQLILETFIKKFIK